MIARIWIGIVVVLLLVAPVGGTAIEVVEIGVESTESLHDEDAVALPTWSGARVRHALAELPRRSDLQPPAHAQTRVFRPPRPSFD